MGLPPRLTLRFRILLLRFLLTLLFTLLLILPLRLRRFVERLRLKFRLTRFAILYYTLDFISHIIKCNL